MGAYRLHTKLFEFLQGISGDKSPLKRLMPYNLSSTYPHNRLYQQVLESAFGKEGSTALAITENSVLSYGQRSFYLKLAAFTTPNECARFLDYIYAAIVAEKPGHYWELLKAIKDINDHCNDTKIYYTADYVNYDEVECNKLLFKNTNFSKSHDDKLPVVAVRQAIQNLIKQHVTILGAYARSRGSAEEYLQSQVGLAKYLDSLRADPTWRLKMISITASQIQNTGNAELVLNWKKMTMQRGNELAAAINSYTGASERVIIDVIIPYNAAYDKKYGDAEIRMMIADSHRHNEEMLLLRDIERDSANARSNAKTACKFR